jgi:hypothetical protein
MKSETMKQDALYSAAKNLLETTLRLLNWNESSPYTREYCEDKVREAIKGLNAEMANKADDRAGKLATLTRRVEELEQEREQWEVNWNNAADFDLCRDLADGKPIAPALGSVPDKLMAKIATLTRRVEELEGASRLFLKACRCVDIQHNGFGRAFDAAQKALHEESK